MSGKMILGTLGVVTLGSMSLLVAKLWRERSVYCRIPLYYGRKGRDKLSANLLDREIERMLHGETRVFN